MKPTHLTRQRKPRTPSTARKTNITTSPPNSTSISKLTRLPDAGDLTKPALLASTPSSKHPTVSTSFHPSSKTGLYPNTNTHVSTASYSAVTNPEVSQITANASPNSFNINDQTLNEDNVYAQHTTHSSPDLSDINQVTTMTDNTFQNPSSTPPVSTQNKGQQPFAATLETYPPLSRNLVNPLPENMTPTPSGQGDDDSEGYIWEDNASPQATEQAHLLAEQNKQQIQNLEAQIQLEIKSNARMKKQIRDLEDKADSYQIHPDNWSSDKEVRSQITGKRSKLLDKLWELDGARETHEQEIEKLKTAKDSAFDLIREAKDKINEVVDALAEHDAYILKNRQNISIMNQNVTAIKQENRGILSQLQEQALKMNASNSFPATKPWMLQSDTNKYSILLAY